MTHASLRDRVVLITGAGRGIGREFAGVLARAGCRLMLTARSATELAQAAAELEAIAGPGRIVTATADVRDPEACEQAVARTVDAFGALHVLVNNAGIGMLRISATFNTEPVKFWEVDPAGFADIMTINAFGPFHMARAAVPRMLEQGFGRIINISTSQVTMVRPGYVPYGPSKAALEAMSRAMADQLAGTGVSVNVLLPGGATDTRFIPGEGVGRRGADGQLLPVSIMNAALLWLASDAANGVSGRSFVGKLWDATLPPDEAAAKAMRVRPELPAIL
jgi:NAD(P)-dependent dehydrogenase (short-subunit alcohol dehydrogenase family)